MELDKCDVFYDFLRRFPKLDGHIGLQHNSEKETILITVYTEGIALEDKWNTKRDVIKYAQEEYDENYITALEDCRDSNNIMILLSDYPNSRLRLIFDWLKLENVSLLDERQYK